MIHKKNDVRGRLLPQGMLKNIYVLYYSTYVIFALLVIMLGLFLLMIGSENIFVLAIYLNMFLMFITIFSAHLYYMIRARSYFFKPKERIYIETNTDVLTIQSKDSGQRSIPLSSIQGIAYFRSYITAKNDTLHITTDAEMIDMQVDFFSHKAAENMAVVCKNAGAKEYSKWTVFVNGKELVTAFVIKFTITSYIVSLITLFILQ